MRTSLCLLLLFLLLPLFLSAQSHSVSGKLTGSDGSALIGASVILQRLPDSSFVAGTVTDATGNFSLLAPRPGDYVIKLAFVGFEDLFIRRNITSNIELGTLKLRDKATVLSTVNIVELTPPALQKGDTTEYNSKAFKTQPDANAEDLVTKMPGIQQGTDGKVQAQGENVQRVLVDGKPFFGDDPNAVLKNLPAEVIDRIQVFDQRSDQSQFTGFDDGNSLKTLNIITKPQFRDGVFGRAFAGAGTEDRWKGGATVNLFNKNRRLTFLLNGNNINEQNFSTEDLLGVMSGSSNNNRPQGMRGGFGGRGGGRGRGGENFYNPADNFLVDQRNGISTTQSFGVNYANKWKTVDASFSYFFNRSENEAVSDLYRTYITAENSDLAYMETSNTNSINLNHRFSSRVEWKLDSLNSFIIQPKFSLQHNEGDRVLLGSNISGSSITGFTDTQNGSDLDGINTSVSLLWRHSFQKRGRSLSLSMTPGYNNQKGNNYLLSLLDSYNDTLAADKTDQVGRIDKQGVTLNTQVNYTEPLSERSQLQVSYGGNYQRNTSDKATFNYVAATRDYIDKDSSLSNNFRTEYVSHQGGLTYRYNKQKWNLGIGANYQQASLDNTFIDPEREPVARNFSSVLPNAFFQYRFSQRKSLRANYRSNNNAPTADQLQSVINNSNPLQLTSGNPDLSQDFQNNLSIRYSAVNTEKNSSFFALLAGSYTFDYIGNSTFVAFSDTVLSSTVTLASGSQYTRPVNLDGYYNLRSFMNYSFPVKFLKSNLNLNASLNYNLTPSLINELKNEAGSGTYGAGVLLSSNISEKVDFSIGTNFSYNSLHNTLQASADNEYYSQISRAKIQVMPWKGLVLLSEWNYTYNTGLSSSINQNILLWNAGIGYKFGKDRAFDLRLTAFDLLEENTSVTRTTTDTYFDDSRTNILQRYFMLTLTYNFKKFREAEGQ